MKTVIFDICGTIYKSNTTFDFLKWKFGRVRSFRIYSRLYHSFVWRCLNRCSKMFVHLDLTRMVAVYYLKGYSKQQLIKDVSQFYCNDLSKKINEEVLDLMSSYKMRGNYRIVIASATLDIIANYISNRIGVKEWYATSLCYNQNVCTGKYENDLLGNKASLFLNNDDIELVVTDDISDVHLLQLSRNCVIVTYPKTENKWCKILSRIDRPYRIIHMNHDIIF